MRGDGCLRSAQLQTPLVREKSWLIAFPPIVNIFGLLGVMIVCIQPDAGSDTIAHELSGAGSDASAHAEVRRSIGCDASLARLQTAFGA